jgi:hypothetical protein
MITMLNKIFNVTLDHLFRPKVNIYAKNDSAARYDAVEVNKLEIYIGAIFLLPLRIILTMPLVCIGMFFGKLIWLIYGSKYHISLI